MGFFHSLRSNKQRKRTGRVEADGYTWSSNGKSISPANIACKQSKTTRVSSEKNKKSKRIKKILMRKPSSQAKDITSSCDITVLSNDLKDSVIISTGSADSYFDNMTISPSTESSDGQDDRRDERQEMNRYNCERDASLTATRQSPRDESLDQVKNPLVKRKAQPLKDIRRNASEQSRDYVHTFSDQLWTLEEAVFEEENDDLWENSVMDSDRNDYYGNITERRSFHDLKEEEELIRRRWAASLKLMNR